MGAVGSGSIKKKRAEHTFLRMLKIGLRNSTIFKTNKKNLWSKLYDDSVLAGDELLCHIYTTVREQRREMKELIIGNQ